MRTERETRAKWLSDDAATILHRYPWPGNVRELESVLERALTQNQHDIIQAADLPDFVRNGLSLSPNSPLAQTVLSVTEAEREAILRAGWACQGRVTDMARLLGDRPFHPVAQDETPRNLPRTLQILSHTGRPCFNVNHFQLPDVSY